MYLTNRGATRRIRGLLIPLWKTKGGPMPSPKPSPTRPPTGCERQLPMRSRMRLRTPRASRPRTVPPEKRLRATDRATRIRQTPAIEGGASEHAAPDGASAPHLVPPIRMPVLDVGRGRGAFDARRSQRRSLVTRFPGRALVDCAPWEVSVLVLSLATTRMRRARATASTGARLS